MTDSDALHDRLDELEAQGANWQRIMVAHALIESGHVIAIECSMPRCIYETREFNHRVRALALSIDHITPQSVGGTHHPDNLRLAHLGCNSAAARSGSDVSERRSAATKRARRAQFYAKRNAEQMQRAADVHDDMWLKRWLSEMPTWLWLESTRKLQSTVYHVNYGSLQGDELADYVTMNVVALTSEIHEFTNEIQWKTWANDRGRVNRDEAVDELVDVGHFLGNLLVVLGVSDVEWEVRYRDKQLRNAQRQEAPGGYSGEKCPNCHRELDREGALVSRNGFGIGGPTYLHCGHCDAPIRVVEIGG